MKNAVFLTVLSLVAASAFAGQDRYDFVKECSFASVAGDAYKVQVAYHPAENDYVVGIESTQCTTPTFFDDIHPATVYSHEYHYNMTTLDVEYNVGNITHLRLTMDPNNTAYGKIEATYKNAVHMSSCATCGSGGQYAQTETMYANCINAAQYGMRIQPPAQQAPTPPQYGYPHHPHHP